LCRHANDGKILTYEEGVAEIQGGHQAIYDVLGWVDPFFRFPYGEASLELKDYLRKHSTGEFLWNVDSEDWKNKLDNGSPNTPQTVVDNVIAQLKPRGRGIILFHDIQRRTAEALPLMLKRLKEEGYQPVLLQPKDLQSRFTSKIVGPRKPIN
jgi:peptidoglycan/xylan/chitin deacetylase (PgdA/CDA1 family)